MTDKEVFFSGLERLDCPSDGSYDDFDCLVASSRRKDASQSHGSCYLERPPNLPRSSVNIASSSDDVATRHDVPTVIPMTASFNESRVFEYQSRMGEPSKRPRSEISKRKRGSVERIIPKQHQIFRGLVFCMSLPVSNRIF